MQCQNKTTVLFKLIDCKIEAMTYLNFDMFCMRRVFSSCFILSRSCHPIITTINTVFEIRTFFASAAMLLFRILTKR
jgi:hypothetical protein